MSEWELKVSNITAQLFKESRTLLQVLKESGRVSGNLVWKSLKYTEKSWSLQQVWKDLKQLQTNNVVSLEEHSNTPQVSSFLGGT